MRRVRPFQTRARAGFTLLELLLAMTIFTLVTGMAAGAFWSITKTWNRSNEMLDQLHYGEFAMNQLVTALRGAAWFSSKPEAFGFWLEDQGGTSADAQNKISWVTSGTAFLPPDSTLQNGLHRLSVTVDSVEGERGLVVRAWPHVAEEVKETDVEAWLIAPEVRGFSCEWYDFDGEDWSQDWEETNSLPKVLRVTMTMEPYAEGEESLTMARIVDLEVAPDLPGQEKKDRTTQQRSEREERENAGNGENANGEGGAPRITNGGTGVNIRGGGNQAPRSGETGRRLESGRSGAGRTPGGGTGVRIGTGRNGSGELELRMPGGLRGGE